MTWLQVRREGLSLTLHIQPGAKKTEVAGPHGDALKIRLAAPPVDGKANAALIDWAAGAFGVPRQRVQLLHGGTGRHKMLAIALADAAALAQAQALVAQWMGPGADKGRHDGRAPGA